MSDFEKKLIARACKKYKRIYPCDKAKSFAECFTSFNKNIIFWFNTEDGSTHVVSIEQDTNNHTSHLN